MWGCDRRVSSPLDKTRSVVVLTLLGPLGNPVEPTSLLSPAPPTPLRFLLGAPPPIHHLCRDPHHRPLLLEKPNKDISKIISTGDIFFFREEGASGKRKEPKKPERLETRPPPRVFQKNDLSQALARRCETVSRVFTFGMICFCLIPLLFLSKY